MHKFDKRRFYFIAEATSFIMNTDIKEDKLKYQYAIMLNLVTLLEAADKIGSQSDDPAAIKNKYSVLPWGCIKTLRKHMRHTYHWFNYDTLCLQIKRDVPALERIVSDIIANKQKTSNNRPLSILPEAINIISDRKAKLAEKKRTQRDTPFKLKPTQAKIKTITIIINELNNIKQFNAEASSDMACYAIQMSLVIISNEIKTGLGRNFTSKYTLIDEMIKLKWEDLIYLGNTCVHNYYNLNESDIFDFATQHCDLALAKIKAIKSQLVTESTQQKSETSFIEKGIEPKYKKQKLTTISTSSRSDTISSEQMGASKGKNEEDIGYDVHQPSMRRK